MTAADVHKSGIGAVSANINSPSVVSVALGSSLRRRSPACRSLHSKRRDNANVARCERYLTADVLACSLQDLPEPHEYWLIEPICELFEDVLLSSSPVTGLRD